MKIRVSLKYFGSHCLWKHFFDSNSTQFPSNLITLAISGTTRLLTLFQPKLKQLSGKKVQKPALLGNCFSDPFTEVEVS